MCICGWVGVKPGVSNSRLEICLFLGPLEAGVIVIPVTEIFGESSKVTSHPAGLGKAALQKTHRRGVFIFVTLI